MQEEAVAELPRDRLKSPERDSIQTRKRAKW